MSAPADDTLYRAVIGQVLSNALQAFRVTMPITEEDLIIGVTTFLVAEFNDEPREVLEQICETALDMHGALPPRPRLQPHLQALPVVGEH